MVSIHSANAYLPLALSCLVVAALAAAVGAAGTPPPAEQGNQQNPVTRIGDRWLAIAADGRTLRFPLFASGDLGAPHPRVTRLVVVVNGTLRNADVYFASTEAVARTAGADPAEVLIVSPQFLAAPDAKAFHFDGDIPYWTADGWKEGAPAVHPEGGPSSYAMLDAILRAALDRRRFPALRTIVVVGHSAGGQVVQRYAATAHADQAVRAAGVRLRYIVSNPSSYLYFDDRRVTADGTLAAYSRNVCPGYNRYRYGLEDANEYVGRQDGAALARQYAQREVAYLLGEADSSPTAAMLDTSCGAKAQGASRLDRGQRYFRYIQLIAGPEAARSHSLHLVPGVGHDHKKMFESPCGRSLLFGDGACHPG